MNDKYHIHKLYRHYMYRDLLGTMCYLGMISHEERWEIGDECWEALEE